MGGDGGSAGGGGGGAGAASAGGGDSGNSGGAGGHTGGEAGTCSSGADGDRRGEAVDNVREREGEGGEIGGEEDVQIEGRGEDRPLHPHSATAPPRCAASEFF
jgi:hypothetical protein